MSEVVLELLLMASGSTNIFLLWQLWRTLKFANRTLAQRNDAYTNHLRLMAGEQPFPRNWSV